MIYLIAVLMGFMIATSPQVGHSVKSFLGVRYANPIEGALSSCGGFGGWACIPPAAYFASNAVGSNYLDGILFVGAAFLGAIVSGFVRGRLAYALCVIALPLNTCLAVYLFYAHQ